MGQSRTLGQYPLRIGYFLWMGGVQTSLAETRASGRLKHRRGGAHVTVIRFELWGEHSAGACRPKLQPELLVDVVAGPDSASIARSADPGLLSHGEMSAPETLQYVVGVLLKGGASALVSLRDEEGGRFRSPGGVRRPHGHVPEQYEILLAEVSRRVSCHQARPGLDVIVES
jgi:hypothetical protein